MTTASVLVADSYIDWLRQRVTAAALSESVTELTTPFVDRHNDHIQIYAERLPSSDAILLTDDGYILAELKSSGVESRGSKREQLFAETLRGYGVRLHGRELQVEAPSAKHLGQSAHNLVQAMLSLDDMFVLAQTKVETFFHEDVATYLDEHDVRYSPRVKFAGKSGLDHLVDFVIPRSKAAPERVLQVLNSARKDRAESLLFAASDAKATRGQDVQYFALVNDQRKPVAAEILAAFDAYDITAKPWSERESLVPALAA